MFRQPGGRRGPGLGLGRSAALALLIASAAALAVGGAYAVVVAVPPLPADRAITTAAAQVPAPEPAPAAYPEAVPGVPRVVVVGDTSTSASAAWPQLACARIGCEAISLSAPGTGWTVPGSDGLAVGDRLDAVVAAAPDVVVLAAGAADTQTGQPRVSGSVNQALYRLEKWLPLTRVVVLSPFWPSAPAPAPVSAVRGWIYHATLKHGDAFVDVTDLFDADHAGLVDPAGGLPTPEGQAYVAEVVTPFLQLALAG